MGPYTVAHRSPRGANDERPTALQVIADQGLQGKLSGKSIIITGATGGIGVEIVRALAATGASLILTVRDVEKAQSVLFDSGVVQSGPHILIVQMNNESLASVQSAADVILSSSWNKVNILICNAGVAAAQSENQITEDGHDLQFGVNYLSHFLLFQRLRDALLSSASHTFPSRVVMVTSSAHRALTNFEIGGKGYATSKLAMIYMANELERRFGQFGLHATSVHPGIVLTNILCDVDEGILNMMLGNERIKLCLKSCEQGAATIVLAAVGKEWDSKGGTYLENCEEARRGQEDGNAFGEGFVQLTFDPQAETQLWQSSLAMLGRAGLLPEETGYAETTAGLD